MLEFLNGISPLWWVAFALALGAGELLTGSTFLLWPAIAAAATAAALFAWPGLGGETQLGLFAVCTVAATVLGRFALSKGGKRDRAADLNNRAELMIGRSAEVLAFANSRGQVEIDGVRWTARWPDGKASGPGDTVKIEGADGATLIVARD